MLSATGASNLANIGIPQPENPIPAVTMLVLSVYGLNWAFTRVVDETRTIKIRTSIIFFMVVKFCKICGKLNLSIANLKKFKLNF
jgi:hypothetical protein